MELPDAEKFWHRLLPDADYRLPMNLRPGDEARFWSLSPGSAEVLAERRKWITEAPELHFILTPECAEAAVEATDWLAAASGCTFAGPQEAACGVEPDWVLLAGDAARGFPVIGGAVVFPSGWGLEEKMTRPLTGVHEPVPGLESAIGAQVATFLSRIAPGAEWERENWGLSAEDSLNQHPSRSVRRLDATASLAGTWLRLERQFLTRLPASGAILFGIHVSNHRLDSLLSHFPALAPRLERALRTMPEPLAEYKGLSRARPALLAQLGSSGFP